MKREKRRRRRRKNTKNYLFRMRETDYDVTFAKKLGAFFNERGSEQERERERALCMIQPYE